MDIVTLCLKGENGEEGGIAHGQQDPLEKGMANHSSFLPGESHGQRSLGDYSPWGHKESDSSEATSHT